MVNIVITAANSLYFDTLKTLISSIHKTSYDIVDDIYIYDIGLSKNEILFINTLSKCKVLNLKELIPNLPFPDYLFPKGHAYKCYCLYHAKTLGKNILWLDAGVLALKSIKSIFDIIENDDIFCVGDIHLNKSYTQNSCIQIMSATESELLDVQLSSGIIGYKSNGIHEHIFSEAYEFSKIEGCVVGDENNHRHDQSVYSILASRYNIKKQNIDIYGYWTDINRNLDTAIKNNAVIFVHRRGYYNVDNLKYKKKIKLLDSSLFPYDYLCHHITPDEPVWSRSENSPNVVVGIASYGINQLINYPSVIKCAYIIEPEIINGEDYANTIRNQDSYDYIFTHDLSLKNKIKENKFIYVFHGGTHLRNEDIKIHEKTKLTSMIFSDKKWNNFHIFRHTIYSMIQNKIDGFGSGCGNYIKYKSEGLNEYCFSIAMENYNSNGLFTEKILDCFLTGTIPIYYGTDDIGNYFNPKGFFQFSNINELNIIMNAISFNIYEQMLPYVYENYEKAKNYIFPEIYIKNFLNKL
jgi:hypothetical protein